MFCALPEPNSASNNRATCDNLDDGSSNVSKITMSPSRTVSNNVSSAVESLSYVSKLDTEMIALLILSMMATLMPRAAPFTPLSSTLWTDEKKNGHANRQRETSMSEGPRDKVKVNHQHFLFHPLFVWVCLSCWSSHHRDTLKMRRFNLKIIFHCIRDKKKGYNMSTWSSSSLLNPIHRV